MEKPSYVALVKSKIFKQTAPRPEKLEPSPISNHQGNPLDSVRHPLQLKNNG